MKLYSHPTGPRPQAFYLDAVTSASSYRLQQQLLQAYNEQLYAWWNPDDLYLACFGDYATRPTKKGTPPPTGVVARRAQVLEDRVGYEVPELLEAMSQAELEEAARVLLEGTLPGFILHVLSQERTIQHRFAPTTQHAKALRHTPRCDEGHARAAGLGKSKPMPRTSPVQTASEATPVSSLPVAACPALPVAGTSLRPTAPCLPTKHTLVHLRVNRAQERRRLKRKRR